MISAEALALWDLVHFAVLGAAGRLPRRRRRVNVTAARLLPSLDGDLAMKKWKAPRIREIAVGLEINAYACARM
jgi:coenzyme PQQ precursor peptide PqqA